MEGYSADVAAPVTSSAYPFETIVRVAFTSENHAQVAARSLSVDEELQAGKAWHSFVADGPTLVATFRATEIRVLRVMVSSFYDMCAVAVRTFRDVPL